MAKLVVPRARPHTARPDGRWCGVNGMVCLRHTRMAEVPGKQGACRVVALVVLKARYPINPSLSGRRPRSVGLGNVPLRHTCRQGRAVWGACLLYLINLCHPQQLLCLDLHQTEGEEFLAQVFERGTKVVDGFIDAEESGRGCASLSGPLCVGIVGRDVQDLRRGCRECAW